MSRPVTSLEIETCQSPRESGSTSRPYQDTRVAIEGSQPDTGGEENLSGSLPNSEKQDEVEGDLFMLRQPETQPISHDQLVTEVKWIYTGLVMVETKCKQQTSNLQALNLPGQDSARPQNLTNDQWRSLMALHEQLLHEHHNFFLVTQHPSASSNLSKIAAKYSMPARMWQHGVHGHLEVLRHRLPDAIEHMLSFTYTAYSMTALLYETVPSFENEWVECLGDIARYRMAIEEEPKDRETWSGIARSWYSKASDKFPKIGRLYHHLAILARPYTIEQLSLYTKALTCETPFEKTRGSIMTAFNPILAGMTFTHHRALEFERLVVKAHGVLYLYPKRPIEDFYIAREQLLGMLSDWVKLLVVDNCGKGDINKVRLKKIFVFLAAANISGILEYGAIGENGSARSPCRRAFVDQIYKLVEASDPSGLSKPPRMRGSRDAPNEPPEKPDHSDKPLTEKDLAISYAVVGFAEDLTVRILEHVLSDQYWRPKEWYAAQDLWKVCLPHVHVMLVFIFSLSSLELDEESSVEKRFPWVSLCDFLTHLQRVSKEAFPKASEEHFPTPDWEPGREPGRPLWEDFILRGTVYASWYFPDGWFTTALDDEERQLETPSMDDWRSERVLWLGHRVSAVRVILSTDGGIN